jgi:hypothetical protein
MKSVLISVSLPAEFDAVSVTVYAPFTEYVWTGFWAVESIVPSLSKSQAQVVGSFVDVSSNVTVSGALPPVGWPVKLATGASGGVPPGSYPTIS